MRTATVIEITTFRLAAGADEAAFLEADRLVQTRFMPRQPGFLRRTTARGEGGGWLVVVLWAGAEQAVAAAEQAQRDRWTTAFFDLVEPSSIAGGRYTELD